LIDPVAARQPFSTGVFLYLEVGAGYAIRRGLWLHLQCPRGSGSELHSWDRPCRLTLRRGDLITLLSAVASICWSLKGVQP